jgi:hypothetical protein
MATFFSTESVARRLPGPNAHGKAEGFWAVSGNKSQ